MRESHQEQIERWAMFVRNNPEWKEIHNEFINALFENNERFIKNLLKEPKGKEKIIEIYNIKNTKGYSWL